MTQIDPLTGLSAARLGLYLHFPYCLARCPYCDFAITVAREIPHARYVDAVLKELSLRGSELAGRTVDSIFIGGGTPSLWEPKELSRALAGIRTTLDVSDDAEISLEANPEVADAARFAAYRAAGVNRLSLGVQSFDTATLTSLGRAHDAAQAAKAFSDARAAGFPVVSLDLIYGVHGQTVEQVRADAQRAVELGPEHLSAYALTVDRDTLAVETQLSRRLRKGELSLPPEDAQVAMVDALVETLERGGLHRYETSNFARPGLHSRHNALYWTGGEYLALGVGATGRIGARRYTNLRGAERYLSTVEEGRLPESESESLSREELFEERLAMGLRLAAGVDVKAVCEAFGESFEARAGLLQTLGRDGFLELDGGWVRLTARGMNVHSAIAARLI